MFMAKLTALCNLTTFETVPPLLFIKPPYSAQQPATNL
jgi:hypothetical protein